MPNCPIQDMKQTLGYYRDDSSWGRKPRKCLPCQERELYMTFLARSNLSKVYIRQKNRYIDEFLRFVQRETGSTDLSELKPALLRKYINDITANKLIRPTTQSTKVAVVRHWLEWLHDNNYLKHDLSLYV